MVRSKTAMAIGVLLSVVMALSMPASAESRSRLALRLGLERQTFVQGATITGQVTWANGGEGPLQIFIPPSTYTRVLYFPLRSLDPASMLPAQTKWSGPGDDGPAVVLAAGEGRMARYDLTVVYPFLPPGEFAAKAVYDDGAVRAESDDVRLKVIEPTGPERDALDAYVVAVQGSEREVVIARALDLLDRYPGSQFTKHARLLLMDNYRGLHRWDRVIEQAHLLLQGSVLSEFEEQLVRGQLAIAESEAGCGGDCNGDHVITVDELIRGVSIALGETSIGACPSVDRSGDGAVTVDELLAAVQSALQGCAPPLQAH